MRPIGATVVRATSPRASQSVALWPPMGRRCWPPAGRSSCPPTQRYSGLLRRANKQRGRLSLNPRRRDPSRIFASTERRRSRPLQQSSLQPVPMVGLTSMDQVNPGPRRVPVTVTATDKGRCRRCGLVRLGGHDRVVAADDRQQLRRRRQRSDDVVDVLAASCRHGAVGPDQAHRQLTGGEPRLRNARGRVPDQGKGPLDALAKSPDKTTSRRSPRGTPRPENTGDTSSGTSSARTGPRSGSSRSTNSHHTRTAT